MKDPAKYQIRCAHDGGFCHHNCETQCYRRKVGATLSTPHQGFPVEVVKVVNQEAYVKL
jgi:hypothetical protein